MKSFRDPKDKYRCHLDLCAELGQIQDLSKKSFAMDTKSSQKAKTEWWRIRKELDERLGLLLADIDSIVFGGFKVFLIYCLMWKDMNFVLHVGFNETDVQAGLGARVCRIFARSFEQPSFG